MSASDREPVGLIAGQGRLPVLIARGVRAAGREVVCVGLRDQYDADLPERCDRFRTAGIIQIGRWCRLLRRSGVREAVMVGRVKKLRMYDPLHLIRQMPDWRAARIWFGRLRYDKRNDAILGAVADEFAREGIRIMDSTRYIPDQMAGEGVLTTAGPTAAQRSDIDFALPIIARLGELDVGQSIAVRDREVIAVEAIEGTDRMIQRAGELCKRGGWTLVKIAKPDQDMRFDVPTVGPQTIENLRAHGGRCLALEAGRVIMVERPKILEAAEKAGVAVVGVRGHHAA
jgi:DUF1009 family protein